MNKQLIIIVYKICVSGLTRQQMENHMKSIYDTFSLRDDIELKDNYIIREIFIPVSEGCGETDVKIIYPQPTYISPEINKLVDEITLKIKEDPSNALKNQWERLVRELKLKKLNE